MAPSTSSSTSSCFSTSTIESLYTIIREYPLAKKVIVCSHYSEGHLLLEQACARCGPVLQTDVQTVEAAALKLAELRLFQEGRQYVRRPAAFWILRHLMQQLAQRTDAYINEAMLTPGIVESVHQAVCDMREDLVKAAELDAGHFVDVRKGLYMKELLCLYERYLDENKLVDFAGLLAYVEEDAEGALYLYRHGMWLSLAARAILQAAAGERLVAYKGEQAFLKQAEGASAGEPPEIAALPLQEAQIFHAAGSKAEVREVFRRLLADGRAFDEVEIIASNYDSAAQEIYAAAAALDIPCTFAGGLPLEYASAGRAALCAIEWLEGCFHAERFIAMLREGLIEFRRTNEEAAASEWIRELERLGIGWGKERYLQLLNPEHALTDDSKTRLKQLYERFTEIFSGLPDEEAAASAVVWSPKELLGWLARLMDGYANIHEEQDALVLNAVKDQAELLGELPAANMTKELAIQYVKQVLTAIRVQAASMPMPGAVHVSSIAGGGGLSGRPVTYIIGMDEHSWSSSLRQNPVLLDEERRRISPELPTSGQRANLQREERDARLAGLRGQVCLSLSSYRLADGKPVGPAFELLQIYRLQAGAPEADFTELQKQLGAAVGYFGLRDEEPALLALDDGDVWASELAERAGVWKDGRAALERSLPRMQRARLAALHREELPLSDYDGVIGGSEWDIYWSSKLRGPTSASRLESYAECPLKYFYSYVLDLQPKETVVYDRAHWLPPVERGNLLHKVFCDYLRKVTRNGAEAPIHDRTLLMEICNRVLAEFARLIPAPSVSILYKECEEIRQDVELFYQEERRRTARPRFFELELALEGEPMTVRLSSELSLRLKGFVDRIDQVGPHEYRIIDYKTGGTSKYKEQEYFAGGTQLQHALYAAAAEQWLRLSGTDAEARVIESAYYFPTVKGVGREVVRLQNRREELAAAVNSLLLSMERGLFVPTSDAKRCRWCEYREVCGPHAAGLMAEKREFSGNRSVLQPLLEVESIG